MLPKALTFLLHYNDHTFHVLVRATDYYNFVLLVLVAMGIVFELPIFVLALVQLGVVSSHKLRHTCRLGYFIVAVVAVALPAIDPVTTSLEAIPLFALRGLGSGWPFCSNPGVDAPPHLAEAAPRGIASHYLYVMSHGWERRPADRPSSGAADR